MEEQRFAGRAERQVAELVQDGEIGISEPASNLSRLSLKLLLLEGVDDVGEEPAALAVVFDGLDADGRDEMRLARAWDRRRGRQAAASNMAAWKALSKSSRLAGSIPNTARCDKGGR
jgi:hypothetical protein